MRGMRHTMQAHRKMNVLLETEKTLKFLGNNGVSVVQVTKLVYGCSPKLMKNLTTKVLIGKLGQLKSFAMSGVR